jgi:dTDP-4-amino-4,6-dideoxygalactose transaminase
LVVTAHRSIPAVESPPGLAAAARIAVARPLLPDAEAIAPYLQRIDAQRWYSNFGPLVTALEARLAARHGPGVRAVTATNATQILALALKLLAPRPGALCALPSWTFVATAHAVIQAGLRPWFLDVDPDTWMLDPEATAQAIRQAPGEVAAVVPVAAFGRPIDGPGWRAFRDRTGIPVLVDAAAAFDAAALDPDAWAGLPAAVSLHATKALGVGEGGYLATSDGELADRLRQHTSFGFFGSREAAFPATNAKISEYAAAVGLAALDAWPHTRGRWMRAAQLLRIALSALPQIRFQPGWGVDWVTSVCVVEVPDGAAERVAASLAEAGIETRRWWGLGCHAEPAFADCARTALPVTERLGASTVGLPFAVDLGRDEIERIAKALAHALDVRPAAASSSRPPQRPLYAGFAYAEAMAGAGAVIDMPDWNTCLVRRPLPDGRADATAPYPLACLSPQADLQAGLARLANQNLISLVVTPDPLSGPSPATFAKAFELARPFKTHYLVDPDKGGFAPTKHHRDRIRRAQRRCQVDRAPLAAHLPRWCELYADLAQRRAITGAAAFSPAYFAMLAAEPQVTAFVAQADGVITGMTLWFEAAGVAYNHLTAVDARGYADGASYALYDAAIAHFEGRSINLGGGSGVGDGAGGLADFKRGFANAEITAWIFGAVLDRPAYAALNQGRA